LAALKKNSADSVSGVATDYVKQYQRKKTSDSLMAIINTKGTVTSVATGYGLSGGTITGAGTLIADTSVSGLSGKYIRITDGIAYAFTGIRDNDLLKYDSVNNRFVNFTLTATSPLSYNPVTNVLSSTGGGTGWLLTGNSGTDTLTDFVGTTDNRDLYFKRNGVKSGSIDSTSGGEGQTSFGFGALKNIDQTFATVIGNTAVGFKAMELYTGTNNGGGNSAFGVRALTALTTGLRNTAIGYNALYTTGVQSDNTAIGYNALKLASTSAINNTAIGSGALDAVTSGTNNTAVGVGALGVLSTGSSNSVVGASSAGSNTGDHNAILGAGIFSGSGAGSYNVAVGSLNTLAANTSGTFNVAICRGALITNTTNSFTTAVGGNAGNLSTGASNGFFGMYSGAYITSETGVLILNTLNRTNKTGDTTNSPFYSVQSTTAASQRTKLGGGGTVGINGYGHSTLAVNGSFAVGYVAKTANYTATIDDFSIKFTSGTDTLTLPTAVGCAGRQYEIKNLTGNTAQIATTSSQTIDGASAPFAVATTKCYGLRSDGANWYIIYVY